LDTGASKNYIKPLTEFKHFKPVETGGHTKIEQKCLIHLFFFFLNNLNRYDGTVGLDLPKKVNAKIDLIKNIIEHDHGTEQIF